MTNYAVDIAPCKGGLDLVTSPIQIPKGRLIACQNYEADYRGYRRFDGYERFDGRPKPSKASYWVMNFDAGQTAISEDDTVTGATSGATGIALQDATVSSGSWGGNDAAGELILYNVSGTFQDNENLEVSASTVAVADGVATEGGASTDALNDTYTQAAIEKRRDAISAITGSGDILGIFTLSGTVYAVRNNAGGTAAQMWQATASGWTQKTFGHTLDFDSGATAEIVEGETISGGTSGATATVERVVLQDGAWSGTAEGYFVLSGISGTFQAAETVTGGTSGGTASAGGAQSAITLPPGGKYRAVRHNFFGTSNLKRVYFVNGEGYAHEWDGTVLAPIRTGLSSSLDKPKHIAILSNHLFLGYDGGTMQFSSTGLPLVFDATTGAGEVGVGDDITGMKGFTKNSMVATARNKVVYVTGSDVNDFQVNFVSEDSGGVSDTLEAVGSPMFLDDRGVRRLEAVQAYGDWRIGTITSLVEPFIRQKRTNSVTPVGVQRVRSKDIYRLFYDDATVLSIFVGEKYPACMRLSLGFTPTVVVSSEDASGNEILLAGDGSGYVYEMDAGTSFDGEEIEAFIRFAFMHQGSPNQNKRYHNLEIEADLDGDNVELSLSSDFSYGNPNNSSGEEQSVDIYGGGGFWNTMFWNQFHWSSQIQGQASAELQGIGTNVSPVIMSDATYEEPHTLTSMRVNYTPRRQVR